MHRDPDRKCPLRSHRSAQLRIFHLRRSSLERKLPEHLYSATQTHPTRRRNGIGNQKRRIVRRFHGWRGREAYRRRYRLFLAHHRLARLATANRYSVLFRFHQPPPNFRLPEFLSIIRKTFRGLDVNCFSARERLIARMDEMGEMDGCDSCQIIREQM
jgi:hypothetical protein